MKFREFVPLGLMFVLVVTFVLVRQFYLGFTWHNWMQDFMAAFFLIFGFLKVINLKKFAKSYGMYDIVTKAVPTYGYVYPFIEVALGFLYLFNLYPFYTNIFTVVLMSIGALGVYLEVRKGSEITCACLGEIFRVPLTYVTLIEDLLMAAMALYMLF